MNYLRQASELNHQRCARNGFVASPEDVRQQRTLLPLTTREKEASSGAAHGRATSGHQGGGQAVRQSNQDGEGTDAGRAVLSERLDSGTRPPSPERCPGACSGQTPPGRPQSPDLRAGGAAAPHQGVGHVRRPMRQASGPVHGRRHPSHGAPRRAGTPTRGQIQAPIGVPGHHRPAAGSRARAYGSEDVEAGPSPVPCSAIRSRYEPSPTGTSAVRGFASWTWWATTEAAPQGTTARPWT
jgi:hypothetical protein